MTIFPSEDEDAELEAGNQARLESARAELLDAIGTYSSADLAAISLDSLQRDHRVLCVRHNKRSHYPKFQFDRTLAPYGEIAEVLVALGGKATRWDVCLWFTEPNEFLDGKTPIEVWLHDRSRVVRAAEKALWFARD